MTLTLTNGQIGSAFAYAIAPRSSVRLQTSSPAGATSVGSVRVARDAGSSSPSGVGVFSLAIGGVTVAEAGVPALGTSAAFRMYAEVSGTPGAIGSLRSGVAITNTSATSTTAMFELTELDGTSTGLRASRAVPPSGHIATFVDELFPTLTTPFQGVLRITSTTTNVAVIGLRARTNKRGDFLITTTPPSNEVRTPSSVDAYFPHIADSGGWATQFVLFSGTAGQTSTGTLSFIDQAGKPLDLSVSSSGSTSGIN